MGSERRLVIVLISVILVGTPAGLRAAMVGINVVGSDPSGLDEVGSTKEAGVEPQAQWNDVEFWEGSTLYDAEGDMASVTANLNTTNCGYSSAVPVSGSGTAGNNLLMRGYCHGGGSEWTVDLAGLASEYGSEGYDLIVYYDGENSSDDWVTEYALSSGGTPIASIFAKDAADSDTWDGTFVEATGTSAADATDGNYVRFSGLTADSITLTATPGTGNAPINGLQLIPAPEPATLGILVAGLALSLVRRRS
jgi:hypothetical protein